MLVFTELLSLNGFLFVPIDANDNVSVLFWNIIFKRSTDEFYNSFL